MQKEYISSKKYNVLEKRKLGWKHVTNVKLSEYKFRISSKLSRAEKLEKIRIYYIFYLCVVQCGQWNTPSLQCGQWNTPSIQCGQLNNQVPIHTKVFIFLKLYQVTLVKWKT